MFKTEGGCVKRVAFCVQDGFGIEKFNILGYINPKF